MVISRDDKVERLELAVLKLQTIVALSEDWQITHPLLLQWKAKLKRVAKEGKAVLRCQKRQIVKHKRSNKSNSIRQQMARVAQRFVPFFCGDEDLSVAMVKRFERLAGSASDFIKFVEPGGYPKKPVFLAAFNQALAAGKPVKLSLRIRSGTAVILLQPWWLEGHDEGNARRACLWMSYEDNMAWEKNYKMMTAFHLSDSVDIMRIAMDCVELLPPQLCAAHMAMKELLAETAFHGRNSPSPSVLYMRFVHLSKTLIAMASTQQDIPASV